MSQRFGWNISNVENESKITYIFDFIIHSNGRSWNDERENDEKEIVQQAHTTHLPAVAKEWITEKYISEREKKIKCM